MPDWLRPLEGPRRPSGAASRRKHEPTSFESAVERFIEEYVSRKTGRPFSSASKRNVRDNLLGGPMTAYRVAHKIVAIEQWSGDAAADYLRWLQHELRRDSATVKKQRSQLRSFGVFCEERFRVVGAAGGELRELPISAEGDYATTQSPPFAPDEAQRLLRAAPTLRDVVAVALLLYTGMRSGELVALQTREVHLDRTPPVVEVRGSVLGRSGGRGAATVREVPLTIGQSSLPRLMQSHLADPARPARASHVLLSSHRLPSGRYPPLTGNGLRQMLDALRDVTGIKCNAYRFRETFCTWCAGAGMPMEDLQLLLGLAKSTTVARYYPSTISQAVLDAASRIRF